MKTVADKKYFTFVKGLNTEAGPLTYPPDTWVDGDNVVPQLDGSLRKRRAMNYETGFQLSATLDNSMTEQTLAYTVHEWNSVGGDGTVNFLVVQRGNFVHIYNNTGNAISPTEDLVHVIQLDSFGLIAGTPGFEPISCVSVMGNLIIVANNVAPLLITYIGGSLTVANFPLLIRDFQGVNDTLAINARPATLSADHQYNLLNQGWTSAQWTPYFTADAVYPSNAQVWTAGKDATGTFQPAVLDKVDFGTSPAPKGRFIIQSRMNAARSAVSGVTVTNGNTDENWPTDVAFFAGRAWYAGMKSRDTTSWVLFSQVAVDTTKYGKCYQDADPTSETVSDLVASDGGVIPIQEIGNILKLVPAFNSMLVFADNGVWQISGTLASGFSASSYEVKKLTTVGCIGKQSIVQAEDAVYYWAADGIWAITLNNVGQFTVQSVTQFTVKNFYNKIPVIGRQFCRGVYYLEGKTVYWLYNDDPNQDGVIRRFKKSRLLCLDLRLGSWFTMTISPLASNSPYPMDMIVTKNKTVFTPVNGRNTDVRFLTQVPTGSNFTVTFSWFEDDLNIPAKFNDWYSKDSVGASYTAFLTSGYDLGENQGGDHLIQGLYITVFMKRTETGVDGSGNPINPSSCTLQTRWNWTDNTVAGKWSPGEQVYRHKRMFQPTVPSATFADGYPVVVTKSKVRGRGYSVQFKFTADPAMDMQLVGWAVPFMGNTNV